jgi:hypothetical protein
MKLATTAEAITAGITIMITQPNEPSSFIHPTPTLAPQLKNINGGTMSPTIA